MKTPIRFAAMLLVICLVLGMMPSRTGSAVYAESTTAPTAPGTYMAAITLDGVKAYVEYSLIYPDVTEWPTASAITYGDALSDSALIGGEADVEGKFSWDEPETVPGVGTKSYTVVFEPEDVNYIPVKMTVEITVDKAVPTVEWDAASFVRDETGEAIDIPKPTVTVPYGEFTGSISYSYAPSGSETFLKGLPAAPGIYTIRGEIAESEHFTAAYGTVLVTIIAAENPDDCGVTRVYGSTRYETSTLVAERFFNDPTNAVLAYAENFPDGLSGGPIANRIGAPLILTMTGREAVAASYTSVNGIRHGFVLGGPTLISDKAVRNIFDLGSDVTITVR